ncbi:transcription factor bHLH128-like isoform X2 [Typha angustifolia]|uniref:transcription factor bHLH128-like isoform X2 n=1 Tax=Typha angustifolia TaxID=59011 RepID=UPI003C2D2D78
MNPSSSGTTKPIAMFPSPHRQSGAPQQQPPPLSRYGSAPGSLLTSLADSVVGAADYHHHHHHGGGSEGFMGRFFSGESSSLTSESSCKASASAAAAAASPPDLEPFRAKESGPQRSYGAIEISLGDLTGAGNSKGGGGGDGGSVGGGNPLVRHSSSPAGFFSQLMGENVTRDPGNYSRAGPDGVHAMANRRLKSQLSFSRQSTLSQISEIDISEMGNSIGGSSHSDEVAGKVGHSYISSGFSLGSWDDTNSIMFSAPSSKRAKDNNEEIIASLSNIESQFSLPRTALEMATVEKYLQIQQDQVPFKVRAKRGCATHPRSIAERERRTRISEKLRKLQELVPNMDKQTSTADMLDLAVQHIKGLQSQVQILAQERENCTCGSKQDKN